MPMIRSIKRTIRRVRVGENEIYDLIPWNRTALSKMIIPEKLKITTKNERFLLFDLNENEMRTLVFGTPNFLHLMRRCKHWYADGTFDVCPALFSQLYTIHVMDDGIVIPIIYALLPDKKTSTYLQLLEKLKEIEPTIAPSTLMVDFELASMNAFAETFPGIQISGCLFHFKQNIFRNICSKGFKSHYNTDSGFRLRANMLPALAYVKPEMVINYFEVLVSSNLLEDMDDVVCYFEDTYIGRSMTGRPRKEPRFPIKVWNVHNSTETGADRTNNKIEGWHRGFRNFVNISHPSIFLFIQNIIKEQDRMELLYEQHLAGGTPQPKRRCYKDYEEKTRAVVKRFNEMDPLDFLRALSHNLN